LETNQEVKLILWLDGSPERAAIAYQRMPDDEKSRVIWTTTAEEAILVLGDYHSVLEAAYLEHDLDGVGVPIKDGNSGYEVVKFIENSELAPKLRNVKFVVNTHNVFSGLKMVSLLRSLGLMAIYKPFGEDK
jgi:hypothetical protein